MDTINLFVASKDYMDVCKYIRESKVKHYPFRRWTYEGKFGYNIELDREHQIVPFLMLKFSLNAINLGAGIVH